MKLGVFTVLFSDKKFEDMLDYVKEKGIKAIEVGTGGNPGDDFCPLDLLLENKDKRKGYLDKIHNRGLTISALSCHNNPLSPNKAEAEKAHNTLIKTIKLAELMNVPVVNTFSGVPGSNEDSKFPNWPVTPWPNVYSNILEWQWEKKLIPYWKETGKIAEKYGVKIALELHAGFLVHTPYTMIRLHRETNKYIGANLDPSHLWWQGIDPVAAIKILGEEDILYHFHAKDTYLDQDNINMHGLTDMQPYSNVKSRSWTFRSVGYGHNNKTWSDIISALRTYGYDYVISIEHEDPIMSKEEGLSKAVQNLQDVIITEDPSEMWWV